MFMQLLKPLGYTYWPLTIISRSIKFVNEDILSRLPPPLALIMFLRQWKHWSMHQQRDHLCHPQMFAFLHKQMPLISLKWQNASPYSERISHFLNTKGMLHFFSFLFLYTNYFANTYIWSFPNVQKEIHLKIHQSFGKMLHNFINFRNMFNFYKMGLQTHQKCQAISQCLANCMTISRTNDHAKFKYNILYRMLYKNLIIIT